MPNDNETRRERRRALAALAHMQANRPLKPPPMPRSADVRSAGRLALEREIREGTYRPRERLFW
jgi:hypothetical protein